MTASWTTVRLSGRRYTTTGSFTISSRLSWRAVAWAITLVRRASGVAVSSSTKRGLRFLSMSTESLLPAWWLSSTTTSGLEPASAEMSAVSSAPSTSKAVPPARWSSVRPASAEFSA